MFGEGEEQGKQTSIMNMEQEAPSTYENGTVPKIFDDDGRPKRTGTFLTGSSHIITAVIGSGVLSLAWAVAQLGWIGGPVILLAFSFITYYTSILLVDAYRVPGPIVGTRNYTYMDAVRAHLGGYKVKLCGLAQYSNLFGTAVGYTLTASISMVAVKKSNCLHKYGHDAKCPVSNYPSMTIFGIIQIILSQIPNLHNLSWLSIVAAVMSFTYSFIGVGLAIAKVAGGAHSKATLTGVIVGVDVSAADKVWGSLQAIGNIAFAYSYSMILLEIQDTLRSPPPENKVMKNATLAGVSVTTFFYLLCGCIGYAAFGNDAPGNFLSGSGFYEPFWLINVANICIVVHLIGAYQVYAQPFFAFVEETCQERWPESSFITNEHYIPIPFVGIYNMNFFRLIWRTIYVIITTLLAMIFPFFNDILGLLGATSFYPLTVYFPVEMHIAQKKIPKYSATWIWLKILCYACLVVSLAATAGSIEGLIKSVRAFVPFQNNS